MTDITPELIDEFVPALKGYADCAGTDGFAINAACLMLETIADALRTGQLIHAAPSGDEVEAVARKFSLGDRVTKTKGSSWTGLVVGFYSTSLTPVGYAVESENEPGSVQIYPENALAALGEKP